MLARILRGQLIEKSVGNNVENAEDDVRGVKRALTLMDRFDGNTSPEPHGIITREMDESVRGFQRDNDLRVDGVLNPRGETEGALLGRVSETVLSNMQRLGQSEDRLLEIDRGDNPPPRFNHGTLLKDKGAEKEPPPEKAEEKPPAPDKKPNPPKDFEKPEEDREDSGKEEPEEKRDCSEWEAKLEGANDAIRAAGERLAQAEDALAPLQTDLGSKNLELEKKTLKLKTFDLN